MSIQSERRHTAGVADNRRLDRRQLRPRIDGRPLQRGLRVR
jgi:hypothetical protein